MKRSWYSDMQRLGRRTGYGMRFVVMMERQQADDKSMRRMTTVMGQPEKLSEHSRLWHIPILNKRSGKPVLYRVTGKPEVLS